MTTLSKGRVLAAMSGGVDSAVAALLLTQDQLAHIHLKEPQIRRAAGQSAVAYRGDEVIGGGIIS